MLTWVALAVDQERVVEVPDRMVLGEAERLLLMVTGATTFKVIPTVVAL